MTALSIEPAQVRLVSGPRAEGVLGATVRPGQAVHLAGRTWWPARSGGTAAEAGADGYGIALTDGAAGQPGLVARPGAVVDLGDAAGAAAGEVYCIGPEAGGLNPLLDIDSGDRVTPLALGIGQGRVRIPAGAWDEGAVARWPMAFGATGPRLAEMAIAPVGGRTMFISRHSMVLRRRMRRIQIGFVNAWFGSSGLRTAAPTSLSLVGARLRGESWSSPLSWSLRQGEGEDAAAFGSPSTTPTVGPGGEIRSALLRPADLGLAAFDAQVVWLDLCGTLPSGSGRFPVGPVFTFDGGVGSTGFCAFYDPTNHVDQLGTAGDMVAPTGALLGSEFGAAGFSSEGTTPVADGEPANNMCVGASYVIGEAY